MAFVTVIVSWGLVSKFKGGDFERICTSFAQMPVLLDLVRFLGIYF